MYNLVTFGVNYNYKQNNFFFTLSHGFENQHSGYMLERLGGGKFSSTRTFNSLSIAWTDLRPVNTMQEVDRIFMDSPFKLLVKEKITPNILQALNLISDRKKEAIKERVSPFWQPLFFEFSGTRNSKIYRGFEEGKMVYFYYRFQKPKTDKFVA